MLLVEGIFDLGLEEEGRPASLLPTPCVCDLTLNMRTSVLEESCRRACFQGTENSVLPGLVQATPGNVPLPIWACNQGMKSGLGTAMPDLPHRRHPPPGTRFNSLDTRHSKHFWGKLQPLNTRLGSNYWMKVYIVQYTIYFSYSCTHKVKNDVRFEKIGAL